MDNGYIEEKTNQAMCCWDAPDKKSVEKLFSKAGVEIESIKVVNPFKG